MDHGTVVKISRDCPAAVDAVRVGVDGARGIERSDGAVRGAHEVAGFQFLVAERGGAVIAPSDAEVTSAAYFAKTPVL